MQRCCTTRQAADIRGWPLHRPRGRRSSDGRCAAHAAGLPAARGRGSRDVDPPPHVQLRTALERGCRSPVHPPRRSRGRRRPHQPASCRQRRQRPAGERGEPRRACGARRRPSWKPDHPFPARARQSTATTSSSGWASRLGRCWGAARAPSRLRYRRSVAHSRARLLAEAQTWVAARMPRRSASLAVIEALRPGRSAPPPRMVDDAERIYAGAVEQDPRTRSPSSDSRVLPLNAATTSSRSAHARRALAIDPENAARAAAGDPARRGVHGTRRAAGFVARKRITVAVVDARPSERVVFTQSRCGTSADGADARRADEPRRARPSPEPPTAPSLSAVRGSSGAPGRLTAQDASDGHRRSRVRRQRHVERLIDAGHVRTILDSMFARSPRRGPARGASSRRNRRRARCRACAA